MAARLSGGWRRRVPAGPRRRFWQHQKRPKWCRFIPALTVRGARAIARQSGQRMPVEDSYIATTARRQVMMIAISIDWDFGVLESKYLIEMQCRFTT
jgi:hypothetical protein